MTTLVFEVRTADGAVWTNYVIVRNLSVNAEVQRATFEHFLKVAMTLSRGCLGFAIKLVEPLLSQSQF